MSEYDDSVMIAYLPVNSDWCKLELPHLTLVYAGLKSDLSPGDFNALAKDAASLAQLTSPFVLHATGLDVFGDEEKVDVLRFRSTPELLATRYFVEDWNVSEHPFNPHVTIGPVGSPVENVPRAVAFDRILVAWGDDHLTFWLK